MKRSKIREPTTKWMFMIFLPKIKKQNGMSSELTDRVKAEWALILISEKVMEKASIVEAAEAAEVVEEVCVTDNALTDDVNR